MSTEPIKREEPPPGMVWMHIWINKGDEYGIDFGGTVPEDKVEAYLAHFQECVHAAKAIKPLS